MNITIRHLEYLISRHDCVIVPGLGAVLAQSVCAQKVSGSNTWLAPRRNYSFNAMLSVSDGLLVGSVARALGISHGNAAGMVADEVAAMRRQLDHDGTLSLGRVGTLSLDEDRIMIFEAAEKDTLTPLSGWYPEICLQDSAELPPVAEYDEETKPHVSAFGRLMRVAASAAVLIAIGLAVSTPVSIKDAQYASLGLPEVSVSHGITASGHGKTDKYEVETIETPATPEQISEVKICEDDSEAGKLVGNAESAEKIPPVKKSVYAPVHASPRLNDFDDYCLVVASLNSSEAADRFILDESRLNPGLVMGVLEQNGRYRIYAATGKTKEQAMAAASYPKISRYKGVWVTRR